MNSTDTNFPIDAVITWVDGKDDLHKIKISQFINDEKIISSTGFRTKLDQVDEIKFAVHSILLFAPFIRNIFIVTDNQIPDFYKKRKEQEYGNVFIIDHQDIFGEDKNSLPTFNSISIETKLYNIPDLAEHFIYFNDDLFLLRQADIADFFIDGLPVLRGKWSKYKEDILIKKLFRSKKKKSVASHIKSQETAGKVLGFKRYYKFHHTPHPLRKSTFKNFFEKNRDLEKMNCSHKFRDAKQFVPQGLANHIEIKNNSCILKKEYQLVYFRNYNKPFLWLKYKLNFVTSKKNKLFLNIQSLDQCPKNKLDYILNWLGKRFSYSHKIFQ